MLRSLRQKLGLTRGGLLQPQAVSVAAKLARRSRLAFEPLEPRWMLDAGPLVISELMAINDSILADEDGDFSDWIEIHNPTNDSVSLNDWYLTDNPGNLTKWQFPSVALDANDYLVVFASDKDRSLAGAELHTNFKLQGGGEYLALVRPDGTTVSHAFAPAFPEQFADVSYGLAPVTTTLVHEGAAATYRLPTGDDAPLGTSWTAADFDDTDWKGGTPPPPVLITEAGTADPDYVEIQNVSAGTVDTSGWFVVANNADDRSGPPDINAWHTTLWELPPAMDPDDVLFRTDIDDGAGNYWGTNIFWRTTGNGWAMLVDDEGSVVDFVVWGYRSDEIATLAIHVNGLDITLGDAWSGVSVVADGSSDDSLQRSGNVDRDIAGDWAVSTPPSMGTANAGLTTPFPSGPSTGIGYSVAPAGFGGAIRTDVEAEMHDANASLWARVPFEVDDPTVLSSLKLRMKYNDGFVAYLNGEVIAHRNAPAPPQWDSAATDWRSVEDSSIYETIDVSDFLDALQAGTNVLAVHGLNVSAADDNFLVLPNLVGASIQGTPRYFSTPTPGEPNAAGCVVINEVHYDPEDQTEPAEFIELYNSTDTSIDLSGWRFDDAIRYNFPVGTSIPGGGYLVVAEHPATIQAKFGVTAVGPWTGRLDNDGECIVLLSASGHTEDEVDYRNEFPWPIASRGDGSSMELIHPALDNDLGGSWRPSGYHLLVDGTVRELEGVPEAGPTPGRQNSVWSLSAPPQIRQVRHAPQQPATGEPVVVTAKVTDPDEVAEVMLSYQLVMPGNYIPAYLSLPHGTLLSRPNQPFDPNPEFEDPANWATVAMADDGTGADLLAGDNVYTAVIPAQPANRTLVRYRITATDVGNVSVTAPHLDDPSLNFAYYVYDGVPEYLAETRSVDPEGPGHVYSTDVMNSLPVYTLVTGAADLSHCIAYDGAYQIPKSNEGARDRFNWEGAFVYDGVVYDHVHYRLRQANDRYGGTGKRSMRFRFNRGNYLAAKDNFGNEYPNKWQTLNTGKMFDNKRVGNFGLTETLNENLWNMMGVPAPWAHTFHFRVVDGLEEAPAGTNGQYYGDFWGMFLAMEDYDTRFLDTHNLPDGNLYKLKDGVFDGNQLRRNQGRYSTTTDADFQNIRNNLRPTQTDQWLNDYVNYDRWYAYHAVVEGIRHYDFVPADSHSKNRAWFFEPYEGSQYGRLWTLPWDADASWGPNWNEGVDYSKNAIFSGAGKPAFMQEYRNTIREFRDLVWTEEVIPQMIDDLAAMIAGFVPADRDRWRNAPADAGYQDFGTMEWKAQNMKDFAFVGWSGSTGPTVPAGGRAAYLDSLASVGGDAINIPHTPTVTSTSPPNFPIDSLTFQTTPFSDLGGDDTFAAIQWRIGEVTDPEAPAYDPDAPRIYEVPAVWESGELTVFNDSITIPGGVLQVGHAYRVRVRMKDTSGRCSHWSDPVQLITDEPAGPVKETLRITEIMYHPAEPTPDELAVDPNFIAEDFEFIELKNTGNETLDLIGFEFSDGIEFRFAADGVTTLNAGEFIVLAKDLRAFEARYGSGINVAGTYRGQLKNSGENVIFRDPFRRTVLNFGYGDADGWPTRADGIGSSLEIVDPSGDYDSPRNWRPSSKIGGTPGAEPGPDPGVVINEVLSRTVAPQLDAIELYNTTGSEVDVGGWYLSDAGEDFEKFQIPTGTVVPAGGYVVFDESDFNPTPLDPAPSHFGLNGPHGDDLWLLKTDGSGRLTHFADNVEFGAGRAGESFGRWPNGAGELYPMIAPTLDPQRPEDGFNSGPRIGPVIISEVHYHPNHVRPDDLEFVEIFNPTDAPVDLTGWRIRKGIDFDFPDGATLGPGSALVVVPFELSEAGSLAAFRSEYGIDESVDLFGGYSGQLSDGGEKVQLQRPDEAPPDEPGFIPHVLEDEVTYDDEAPWPLDPDGSGPSLNRAETGLWGNAPTSWNVALPTPGSTFLVPEGPRVVGRHVFYNHSAFDGNDAEPNAQDDDAIATDKTALLPGGAATFANYTSYASGINGIMVDVEDLPQGAEPGVDDFRFRVGNSDDPGSWTAAPAPAVVTLRPGAGIGGSGRVTIIWPDNVIRKQWLQVAVLVTANTGLDREDVFYFGNAPGDSGNSATDAKVNVVDMLEARSHPRTFLNPAPVDFAYDFNRDARVNAYDMLIARNNQTGFLDALALITVPAEKPADANAAEIEKASVHDAVLQQFTLRESGHRKTSLGELSWLYEFSQPSTSKRSSREGSPHGTAVDKLLATCWP